MAAAAAAKDDACRVSAEIEEDGTEKRRLITDLRRSGANEKTTVPQRVVLPRLVDQSRLEPVTVRVHTQHPERLHRAALLSGGHLLRETLAAGPPLKDGY